MRDSGIRFWMRKLLVRVGIRMGMQEGEEEEERERKEGGVGRELI